MGWLLGIRVRPLKSRAWGIAAGAIVLALGPLAGPGPGPAGASPVTSISSGPRTQAVAASSPAWRTSADWALSSSRSKSTGTEPSFPKILLAADFFGDADPLNFWTSNLAVVPADFKKIRDDGFNTVGLVIPWGEFEPSLTPVRYDSGAFSRLRQVVTDARRAHLDVIVRISYSAGEYPGEQLPGEARILALFGNPTIRQAFFDYVGRVHSELAGFNNVRGGYFSWEDFWGVLLDASRFTAYHRLRRLAHSLGFTTWLRNNYKLSQIDQIYGSPYRKWWQVPVPTSTQAAYSLLYQFEDDTLEEQIFPPSLRLFPGLSLEARVVTDRWIAGGQPYSFSHAPTLRLAGTDLTGIFISPYMGDPSSSTRETVSQAIQGLRSTLASLQAEADGRPLVVYEYEFVSNAPQVSSNPALPMDEIVPYLKASVPILKQYTDGYGIWTYRNYNSSPLNNPSFALGSTYWSTKGHTRVVTSRNGSYLEMSKGSSTSQAVPNGLFTSAPTGTVSFMADTSKPTTISVRLNGRTKKVQLAKGRHSYHVKLAWPTASNTDDVLLAAGGSLKLSEVELYTFTQQGGVYDVNGQPGVAAAEVRTMNHQMVSPSTSSRPPSSTSTSG